MKSANELVAQANSRVKTVTAQEAMLLLSDPDTVFVDLRDGSELQRDGKIPGALHVQSRHAGVHPGSHAAVPQSGILFRKKSRLLLREWGPFGVSRRHGADHGTRAGFASEWRL